MDYIQIGIGLISILLALNPYYQNEWLSLGCAFFAGGFLFLGVFGNRGKLIASRLSLYDKLGGEGFGLMLFLSGAAVVFSLLLLGNAIYNIVIREMDIQAAKAGISTPIATPVPEASKPR